MGFPRIYSAPALFFSSWSDILIWGFSYTTKTNIGQTQPEEICMNNVMYNINGSSLSLGLVF